MMRASVLFLSALWLLPTLSSASAQPTPADHLKCYKIDDPLDHAAYAADLDGLVPEPGCTIKMPAQVVCVPSTKTNVTPPPPGIGSIGRRQRALVCYNVDCPKSALPTLEVNDQFGSRTVTPLAAKLVCGPTCGFPGTPECEWEVGDVVTYSQVYWSDDLDTGSVLGSQFFSVYPLGFLEIGIPGTAGFSILFITPSFIRDYLPAIGPPGPLNADLHDPGSSSSGVFGGEVLALTLNIDFSDAEVIGGNFPSIHFGDLILCNMTDLPDLDGLTVREVLGIANTLLGGSTAIYSIAEIYPITEDLNNAFGGGGLSTFAQDHLVNGACL